MIEESEKQLVETVNLVESIFHKKHPQIRASETPYYLDGLFKAAMAYRNASKVEMERLKELALKQHETIKAQDYAINRMKRESEEGADARVKLQKIQQVLGQLAMEQRPAQRPEPPPNYPPPRHPPHEEDVRDPYKELESDFDSAFDKASREHDELHEKINDVRIQEKFEQNFRGKKDSRKDKLITDIKNTLDVSWGKADGLFRHNFTKKKSPEGNYYEFGRD